MRQRVLTAMIVTAAWMGLSGSRAAGIESGSCQILDKPLDHLYEVGLSYLTESRFEGYGKSGVLELDADWAFGYKDFGDAEMDFNLIFEDIFFLRSADLDLPDQIGELVLDSGITIRGSSGVAARIRMRPGIYSDFENITADSFRVPVSWSVVRTFTPTFSGTAGVEARPGFDLLFRPLVGVAWKISDDLRLEAGLPSSRFQWAITPDLGTYVGFNWQNTSYALTDSSYEPGDQMTIEDVRLFWGMMYKASDILQFRGELGSAFNRSVEFEGDREVDVDVANALYVKFGIGGPF